MIPLEHSLILAGTLFCVGLLGLLTRRNLIFIFLSIEVMLNAAGFAFVAVSNYLGQADGQIFFLVILSVAAAEVAVGLALALKYHHVFKSLDIDVAHDMRG